MIYKTAIVIKVRSRRKITVMVVQINKRINHPLQDDLDRLFPPSHLHDACECSDMYKFEDLLGGVFCRKCQQHHRWIPVEGYDVVRQVNNKNT